MHYPGGSKETMLSAAVSDQGRWAATSPQVIPSRMRNLAGSRTGAGMEEGEVKLTHEHSCPVNEEGADGSSCVEKAAMLR